MLCSRAGCYLNIVWTRKCIRSYVCYRERGVGYGKNWMKFKPYKYNPHLITASFVLRFGGNKNENLKIDNNSLESRESIIPDISTFILFHLPRFR